MSKETIHIAGQEIALFHVNEEDYLSLNDMVHNHPEPDQVIRNWLGKVSTLEYLAAWERLYNPHFKHKAFERLRSGAGTSNFTLSIDRWIGLTGAIGFMNKEDEAETTFAHRDIAFHFGETISPTFHLLLIREFQRLQEDSQKRLNEGWDPARLVAKVSHTLFPKPVRQIYLPRPKSPSPEDFSFVDEGDLLDFAVFGMTAQQFQAQHVEKAQEGNLRDFASIEELTVLSNLETYNAELIRLGVAQETRLVRLISIAQYQLEQLARGKDQEDFSG